METENKNMGHEVSQNNNNMRAGGHGLRLGNKKDYSILDFEILGRQSEK